MRDVTSLLDSTIVQLLFANNVLDRKERENTADCTTSAPAIGSDAGVMYEPPIRALPRFITTRYRGVGNCKRIARGRRIECPEINRRVIFSRLNGPLPARRYSSGRNKWHLMKLIK